MLITSSLDQVYKGNPVARSGHGWQAEVRKMNRFRFMLVALTAMTASCSYHKPENSDEPQFDLVAHCPPREAMIKKRPLVCNAEALLQRFDRRSVADFDKVTLSAKHGQ